MQSRIKNRIICVKIALKCKSKVKTNSKMKGLNLRDKEHFHCLCQPYAFQENLLTKLPQSFKKPKAFSTVCMIKP